MNNLKEQLQQEMLDVINTTKSERTRLINEYRRMSQRELDTTKTIINANKNIVSAAIVIKGLLTATDSQKE